MTTEDTNTITYVVSRSGGREVLIEVPSDATLELELTEGSPSQKLMVRQGGKLIACFTETYSFYPEYMEPKKQEFAGSK